jgi:tripartite-type tricarboxylate transporter receptor subunit TctC
VATDFLIGSKDSHTFLFNSTGGFSVKPHLMKLRHDPWRDVKPVSVVTSAPYLFVARAGLNVKTMAELTTHGKNNVGKLTMAVAGLGTINHLLSGMYLSQSGVQAVLVPYTGAAPAVMSLLASETDIMVVDPGAVLPFIKDRRMIPLAVTDSARLPFLPDVPTTAEAGFPGVEGTALWSLFAPAATPDTVVQKLRQSVIEAGSSEEYRTVVNARLMVQRTTTPEQLTQLMRTEEVRYKKAIDQLDIKLQ